MPSAESAGGGDKETTHQLHREHTHHTNSIQGDYDLSCQAGAGAGVIRTPTEIDTPRQYYSQAGRQARARFISKRKTQVLVRRIGPRRGASVRDGTVKWVVERKHRVVSLVAWTKGGG